MSSLKLWLACLACATAASALAEITINPNVKDGDEIAGVFEVVATCSSDSTVTQVEFYLDDDLVTTDSSTPYQYKIDTIGEKEGDHKLTISAYAENGDSKTVEVSLKVNNHVDLGAAHHVEEGEAALRVQDFDKAIIAGRVALKADKENVPAYIVLGRAYIGKGNYAEAQLHLEDAIQRDEQNSFALDLLAQVHVQRAIGLRAGADTAGAIPNDVRDAYLEAIKARRKSLEARMKALGPPTEENLPQRLELLAKLQDYNTARALLKERTERDLNNADPHNKLLFFDLRLGNLVEARRIYELMMRRGIGTAETYGMGAVLASLLGNEEEADKRIEQALKMDRKSLSVKLCQAFVALERGGTTAGAVARDLVESGFTQPEVYYSLGRIYFQTSQYDLSQRAYEKALLQEPMDTDVYVARGLESLRFALRTDGDGRTRQLDLARGFFDIALAAKPESPGGLVGNALTLAYKGDEREAAKYANGATVVGKESAWVNYVSASIYAKAGMGDRAQECLNTALKLNPEGITIISIPTLSDGYRHMTRFGRTPVLVMP